MEVAAGILLRRGESERNDPQSADERESEETEMSICQVLVSFRVKGDSGTEERLS